MINKLDPSTLEGLEFIKTTRRDYPYYEDDIGTFAEVPRTGVNRAFYKVIDAHTIELYRITYV